MSTPKGLTDTPVYKNPTLLSIAEGNGSFNNIHLAALVLGIPWFVKRTLPIINRGGFKTYLFLVLIMGVPITIGYWTVMSMFGPRINEMVVLPGKDIEEYITIKDPELKAKYHGKEKIPMQIMHDAYFDGKIDFNGVWFCHLSLCILLFAFRMWLCCPRSFGLSIPMILTLTRAAFFFLSRQVTFWKFLSRVMTGPNSS